MMRKYKLIKEYPGSPELGTICEERNRNGSFCYYFEGEKNLGILKNQVENQPEYWQEVNDNIWWIVFKNAETMFHSWTPYRIETMLSYHKEDTREYFKTEEEAKTFIIFNKPCLSYDDVRKEVKKLDTPSSMLSNIFNIVKSKI